MQPPLTDYGLVGDTHTTALISRDGSVDWLCWPRHDSPALFLKLLDDERGGNCSIELCDLVDITRRYVPETNILETRFRTKTGTLVLTDFMPVHPPTTRRTEGPDGDAESRLIRFMQCVDGFIRGDIEVRPTFDYARQSVGAEVQKDGSATFESADVRIRVNASEALRVSDDRVHCALSLTAGEDAYLVLTQGADDASPAIEGIDGARQRLESTRRYWTDWSGRCTYRGQYRETVLRSVLCLKLLTYAPSGAIIAAPTASLPEAIPGNRNFDYRYAWLRDASFTVTSFANLGYTREAAEYLRFLREQDGSHGRETKLMYAIEGPAAAEETLDHLSGYRNARPVRIGNGASDQDQHDIYGEFLLALHVFLESVDYDPPQKTNDHLPEILTNLTERALAARDEPDHGIWEPRTGKQHMLHTKALIWVALTRAADIGEKAGLIDDHRTHRWRTEAAGLHDEYMTHAWNQDRQALTQAYGSDVLDASVLRCALFGAIDVNDPRFVKTGEAIDAELADGDLVYRYRMDDGFEGAEGTFMACAFWRVGCLAMQGKSQQAEALFERLLARGNDLGLFGEEIDAHTGEHLGNYPQGFTHMAIINHALRVEKSLGQQTDRSLTERSKDNEARA